MAEYFRAAAWLGAARLISACDAQLPDLDVGYGEDAGAEPLLEPSAPGGAAQILRLSLPAPALEPLPRLFLGELSRYQLSRADDPELSRVLQARLVPTWTGVVDGTQRVAPLMRLDPDRYTLVTGARASYEFDVVPLGEPTLRRVWPASGISGGASVYCVDGVPTSRLPFEREVEVPSAEGVWVLLPGAECAVMQMNRLPRTATLTALRQGGLLAEPTVFHSQQARSQERAECDGEAVAWGCVRVSDGRVLIQGPSFPTFWRVGAQFSALEPGAEWTISELPIRSETVEQFHVWDAFGRYQTGAIQLRTAEARSRLVINEVMAAPIGPEPTQEWVELYNAGTAPVNLEGWKLGDAEGLATLPNVELDLDHFALIVPDGFDERLGWGVVPEANTLVIRVSRLGAAGLSNGGEALRLLSPSGRLVSRLPADPPPGSGISVARRDPWSADKLDGLFGLHAPPGASPGARNILQ